MEKTQTENPYHKTCKTIEINEKQYKMYSMEDLNDERLRNILS